MEDERAVCRQDQRMWNSVDGSRMEGPSCTICLLTLGIPDVSRRSLLGDSLSFVGSCWPWQGFAHRLGRCKDLLQQSSQEQRSPGIQKYWYSQVLGSGLEDSGVKAFRLAWIQKMHVSKRLHVGAGIQSCRLEARRHSDKEGWMGLRGFQPNKDRWMKTKEGVLHAAGLRYHLHG